MAFDINRLPSDPFTRQDALALGMRGSQFRIAVRDGLVVNPLVGAYVRADVELTTLVRARAAALVTNPGSVIRDRTAAWILGVDCFDFAELDGVPDLEMCVMRGSRAANRTGVDGGSRDLLPHDWLEIAGVRVTTPVRTAMDLACRLSPRLALAAMDQLMRLHGFTTMDMARELSRYFRRRGVVQLRALVPLVDGRSESMGESWARFEILDHGLPRPVVNHWVLENGSPRYRLDLAYPRAKVCVEYDGQEFHTSEEQQERDRVRRDWLRDRDWVVIVVTKESFTPEAVAVWIGELRRALELATKAPAPAYRRGPGRQPGTRWQ